MALKPLQFFCCFQIVSLYMWTSCMFPDASSHRKISHTFGPWLFCLFLWVQLVWCARSWPRYYTVCGIQSGFLPITFSCYKHLCFTQPCCFCYGVWWGNWWFPFFFDNTYLIDDLLNWSQLCLLLYYYFSLPWCSEELCLNRFSPVVIIHHYAVVMAKWEELYFDQCK